MKRRTALGILTAAGSLTASAFAVHPPEVEYSIFMRRRSGDGGNSSKVMWVKISGETARMSVSPIQKVSNASGEIPWPSTFDWTKVRTVNGNRHYDDVSVGENVQLWKKFHELLDAGKVHES